MRLNGNNASASKGTDSERGNRFVERILMVVATCRQQGRNTLQFVTEAIQSQRQGAKNPSLIPVGASTVTVIISLLSTTTGTSGTSGTSGAVGGIVGDTGQLPPELASLLSQTARRGTKSLAPRRQAISDQGAEEIGINIRTIVHQSRRSLSAACPDQEGVWMPTPSISKFIPA
jgi:hypothetical protein